MRCPQNPHWTRHAGRATIGQAGHSRQRRSLRATASHVNQPNRARPQMEFDLNTAVPVLERTPQVLEVLLNRLPVDWTTENEGPGTWTMHEIIAHLIHAEHDDWMPRVLHLLEWGTTKPFAPFDRTFGFEAARAREAPWVVRIFRWPSRHR